MSWEWIGPPVDVRAVFPVERRELLSVLGSLHDTQWQLPTGCPGWSVHDLVAHIAHDYLRRLSRGRDGHQHGGPGPGEDLPAFLARANDEVVRVARGWSPRVLVGIVERFGPDLDALWAAQDPQAVLDGDVWWAAPGVPAPAWLDTARELSELWLHQQQLRDAVGAPNDTRPETVGAVVDTLVRGLPRALELHDPPGRTLTMNVTGPAPRRWTASRRPDGWRLDPGAAPDADAVVNLDADTLWRLASRGIEPGEAGARAIVRGDRRLAAAALHLLSIIR